MMMRRMGMMLACFFLFAAVAGSAPAEISYMFHIPPTTPEFKIYEGLLELFVIKNRSIRVQLLTATGSYLERLRVMAAAGAGADATFLANWDIAPLAEDGLLLPLDRLVTRDKYDLGVFFPMVVELCYYRHRSGQEYLYALPRHPSPNVVYYNVDMYSNAGLSLPPTDDPGLLWNWNTYLDTARKLSMDKNGDGVNDQYGSNVLSQVPHVLLPLIRSFGGGIIDGTTRRTAFNEFTVEGLRYAADMRPVYQAATHSDLSRGDLANMVQYYPMMQTWAKSPTLDWNIAHLPAGRAGRVNRSVAGTYAIMSGSKHPDAAWELLKFLCSDEAQMQIGASGVVMPARIATARKLFQQPPDYMRGRHLMVFADELMATGQKEAVLPESTRINEVFSSEVQGVFSGKEAAQTALARLAGLINGILEGSIR
jgi:multiple sugar transport system substrate-binding protein